MQNIENILRIILNESTNIFFNKCILANTTQSFQTQDYPMLRNDAVKLFGSNLENNTEYRAILKISCELLLLVVSVC